METRYLVQGALIAAIYVALTLVFQPISFLAVQLRVSEALTVLPILTPAAVPGLFVGVLLANALGSPIGLIDVILGSLLTLAAAALTRLLRRNVFLALLPPILINGFGVSAYLVYLLDLEPLRLGPVVLSPYWGAALTISAGQAVAVFGLGYPLLLLLRRVGRDVFER
ncbi:MAG: QueT transporter family protein [Actinobacteria bacterium]|nr:MAG: QueT transporter family protein [Actinomycetota bacterium]